MMFPAQPLELCAIQALAVGLQSGSIFVPAPSPRTWRQLFEFVDTRALRHETCGPNLGAWKDDPKIQLVFGALTDCTFGRFGELVSILGVNALLKCFEWRYARFRVEGVQSKHLLRPMGDFLGSNFPRPAASTAQPLRFG
jgi:hypothetical protein